MMDHHSNYNLSSVEVKCIYRDPSNDEILREGVGLTSRASIAKNFIGIIFNCQECCGIEIQKCFSSFVNFTTLL